MQLEHQGDSTKGDSGGPFFSFWPDGFPYVIGIVSGGEAVAVPKTTTSAQGERLSLI
jgi:hypothetical protein